MAMTKADKIEIKEMFHDGIAALRDLFEEKLNNIEKQTTKTNGTVLSHTDQINDLKHNVVHTTANCPHTNTINELRDDSMVSKGIKKWQIALISIIGAVFGSIVSAVAIFEFILKYKA